MTRHFDVQNGVAGVVQHDKNVVQAWGRSRNLAAAEIVANSSCCDGVRFYSDPKFPTNFLPDTKRPNTLV